MKHQTLKLTIASIGIAFCVDLLYLILSNGYDFDRAIWMIDFS
jgi:hypothetical protein